MKQPLDDTITFRTHKVIKQKIGELAQAHGRSVSWVINQQLKQMVSDQTKHDIDKEKDKDLT